MTYKCPHCGFDNGMAINIGDAAWLNFEYSCGSCGEVVKGGIGKAAYMSLPNGGSGSSGRVTVLRGVREQLAELEHRVDRLEEYSDYYPKGRGE